MKLYMTVGLPRSGKTTWAKMQIERGAVVVNPDSIRLAIYGEAFQAKFEDLVWFQARIMIDSLFRAGHTKVILDATGITRYNRGKYKNLGWVVEYVNFDTPPTVCIQRALSDDRSYLVSVIQRMADEFEPIADYEGTWYQSNGFFIPRS